MADYSKPFLGVPEADIKIEGPDGVSTLASGACDVKNSAWDTNRPWPATLVPGNFDSVQSVPKGS